MPEEIKLHVTSSYDDKGAKEALKDKEELEKATAGQAGAAGSAPSPSTRAYNRQMDQEAAAAMLDPKEEQTRRVNEAARLRRERRAQRSTQETVGAASPATGSAEPPVISRELHEKRAAAENDLKNSREAADNTRERHSAEKAITTEHKTRDEIAKAQMRRISGIAGGASSGFSSTSGLPSFGLGSMISNPLAALGLGAGLLGGRMVSDHLAKMETKRQESETYAINESRRERIASGDYGDDEVGRYEAARGTRASNRQELDEALVKKGKMKPGFWDSAVNALNTTKSFMRFGPASVVSKLPDIEAPAAKAERENNERIERLQKEKGPENKQLFEQAMKSLPGMERERSRALANFNGKAARRIELEMLRMQEYSTAIDKFGKSPEGESAAREMASLAVGARVRQQTGNYARLVTARDGMGDVARIANLAREQRLEGTPGAERQLEALRNDMNGNHREALNSSTRKDFFTR